MSINSYTVQERNKTCNITDRKTKAMIFPEEVDPEDIFLNSRKSVMWRLFIFLNKHKLYNTRTIIYSWQSWFLNTEAILWYSMSPNNRSMKPWDKGYENERLVNLIHQFSSCTLFPELLFLTQSLHEEFINIFSHNHQHILCLHIKYFIIFFIYIWWTRNKCIYYLYSLKVKPFGLNLFKNIC